MALDLIEEFEALIEALDAQQLDYAVCGGLALAIHGHPRATEDIDLLVRFEVIPQVLALARPLGFDIPARAMTFGLRTKTPRKVQRVSKLDDATSSLISLDLLDVSPDLEDVWSGRVSLPWQGRTIRVVSRDGLVTMKRLAGRPQDLADIATLTGTDDDDDDEAT